MFLVDSHCHFDLLDLTPEQGQVEPVIKRAQANGVHYFLNVSVNIRDFPRVLKTAQQYPFVGASVGLHPNDQEEEVDTETLIHLGQADEVIAIGETGLDYYRTSEAQAWQQARFRAHIHAAQYLKKPLIVHTRAAREDTLHILRTEKATSGVMHCFTEDWETAKAALDLNFYISFSGIVTFKNAETIQQVAKRVPLDRLLIETDAPYLAPNPYRGKPNEPGYVYHTAAFIAALRDVPLETFAQQTTDNFFRLFTGAVKLHV